MKEEIMVSTLNRQFADVLLSTTIPGATQCEVKKYTIDVGQVFYIAITFVSTVGATVLANLLYDAIRKPGNENTQIDDQPVPQNLTQIQNMIILNLQQKESKRSPKKQADKKTD